MGLVKGYIQIYTGNGKGKTAAALGQALRVAGRGLKTFIVQFKQVDLVTEMQEIKHYYQTGVPARMGIES